MFLYCDVWQVGKAGRFYSWQVASALRGSEPSIAGILVKAFNKCNRGGSNEPLGAGYVITFKFLEKGCPNLLP
jgi:hypothetical protein